MGKFPRKHSKKFTEVYTLETLQRYTGYMSSTVEHSQLAMLQTGTVKRERSGCSEILVTLLMRGMRTEENGKPGGRSSWHDTLLHPPVQTLKTKLLHQQVKGQASPEGCLGRSFTAVDASVEWAEKAKGYPVRRAEHPKIYRV